MRHFLRQLCLNVVAAAVIGTMAVPVRVNGESCCGGGGGGGAGAVNNSGGSGTGGCEPPEPPSYSGPEAGCGCTGEGTWAGKITRTYSNGQGTITTEEIIGNPLPTPPPPRPQPPPPGYYLIKLSGEAHYTGDPRCPGAPVFYVTPAPTCPLKDSYYAEGGFSEDAPPPPPCGDDDDSSGGGGSGGSGGGCNGFGGFCGSAGSIHLNFHLGMPTLPGGSGIAPVVLPKVPRAAVFARVNREHIDDVVYSTESLRFFRVEGMVVVDPGEAGGGNRRRQVLTGSGLSDFVPNAASESRGYEARFYNIEQLTWNAVLGDYQRNEQGYYQPAGNPFATWKVEDVSAPEVRASVRVSSGAQGLVQVFSEDLVNGGFTVDKGNGERVISVTETQDAQGRLVQTRKVLNGAGELFAQEVIIKAEGRIVERQSGVGADTITTNYDYDGAGTLLLMRRSAGGTMNYWERYLRPNPTKGTITVRPYKNTALPADPLNSSNDDFYLGQCHVIDASQSDLEEERVPADDGSGMVAIRQVWITRFESDFAGSPDPDKPWKLRIVERTRIASANQFYGSASQTFGPDTPEPFAGRPLFEQNEDGTTRSYWYERGDWDATTGAFTLAEAGEAVRTSVIEGVPHGGSAGPMMNVTKKEVTVTDARDRTVAEESWLCTNEAAPDFTPLTRTLHNYDAEGHLVSSVQHAGVAPRTLYSATWADGRKTSETDASGIETVYEDFDGLGRARRVIRKGAAAADGLPAIPDRVVTRVFDPLGRIRSETISAGGQSFTRTRDYDLAGRLTAEAFNGAATAYSYENGGLKVIRTRSGGLTEVAERDLDGETRNISGTGVLPQATTRGVMADGFQWRRVSRGSDANPLWGETVMDKAGRTVLEKRPGSAGTVERSLGYDGLGQLQTETASGSAPRMHTREYGVGNGGAGLLEMTSQDSGTDGVRTEWSAEFHASEADGWYRVRVSSHGTTKSKVAGFAQNEIEKTITIDPLGNVTTAVATIDGFKIVRTTSRAGENPSVTISRCGLVQSVTTPSVSAPAIFGYDGMGRRVSARDPRTTLETATDYEEDFGKPWHISGPGQNVTNTYYPKDDPRAGQLKSRTLNGKTTYYDYNSRGQLTHVWGPATYPLRYEFDDNGRFWKLHTYGRTGAAPRAADWGRGPQWPGDDDGGHVTTWEYFAGTELLQAKKDALGQATTYAYTPSGQLQSRIWARLNGSVWTSYAYNGAGELKTIDYGDATPDVSFGYDADGHAVSITDAAGDHTLTYDALGQLTSDSIGGMNAGILSGVTLSQGYTQAGVKGRLASLDLTGANGLALHESYTYEPGTGRMQTAGSGNTVATYAYLPNSDWLHTTSITHNGVGALTTTRTPDTANRLLGIASTRGGQPIESHTWRYDAAGQRDRDTGGDGSYWEYDYNDRGEVTGGVRKLADGATLSGYSFGYGYDPIGNRSSTVTNGRSTAYNANLLNQYEWREVPGVVDVLGSADAANTTRVTVTGPQGSQIAAKQGSYFHATVPVDNSAEPQYPTLSIEAVKGGGMQGTDYVQSESGKAYLPKNPETFTHDEDGNLTSDGRWQYTWDAENRLIAMETIPAVPWGDWKRLEFDYDWRGRRIQKRVWDRFQEGNREILNVKFVYDSGWNLLAESTANGWRTYLWGTDLSGDLRGAGGVGGLLAINDPQSGTAAVAYDGNGNIVALVSATDGSFLANYQYSPFGETLRATGSLAQVNPFRFSTKYTDSETGLVYYGYRYYAPQTGRWVNRDPAEKQGGTNLYTLVFNYSVGDVDYLGLYTVAVTMTPETWSPPRTLTPGDKPELPDMAGYSEWELKVTCWPVHCGTKEPNCYKVACHVAGTGLTTAYKNKSWNGYSAGGKKWTDAGILGHEQRHLQNIFRAMQKTKKDLEQKVAGPSPYNQMVARAKELQETSQKYLQKVSDEEEFHSGGRAPFAGQPYDPLD